MSTSLNSVCKFYYSPDNLPEIMAEEFEIFRKDILPEIEQSKVLELKFIKIEKIEFKFEMVSHQSGNKHICKLNVTTDSPEVHFNETSESPDFLNNPRTLIHHFIKYFRELNQKLDSKKKSEQATF